MTKKIKDIILFYTITLVCLLISSYGIFIINSIAGIYCIGASLTAIPLLTIFTLIYQLKAKQ